MGFALVVGLNVAEVTRVTFLGVRQTVLVTFRVVMATSTHTVSSRAVPILMYVESVLLPGRESFNVGDHLYGVTVLSEMHYTMTVLAGCWVQDRHCLLNCRFIGSMHVNVRSKPDGCCQYQNRCFHNFYRSLTSYNLLGMPALPRGQ